MERLNSLSDFCSSGVFTGTFSFSHGETCSLLCLPGAQKNSCKSVRMQLCYSIHLPFPLSFLVHKGQAQHVYSICFSLIKQQRISQRLSKKDY